MTTTTTTMTDGVFSLPHDDLGFFAQSQLINKLAGSKVLTSDMVAGEGAGGGGHVGEARSVVKASRGW